MIRTNKVIGYSVVLIRSMGEKGLTDGAKEFLRNPRKIRCGIKEVPTNQMAYFAIGDIDKKKFADRNQVAAKLASDYAKKYIGNIDYPEVEVHALYGNSSYRVNL